MEIHQYSLLTDFPNQTASIEKLTGEIASSDIVPGLDHIDIEEMYVDLFFKDALSVDEKAILDNIIANHDGVPLTDPQPPRMPDGREIIRADTRPLGTQTIFTMAGDSTGVGDGQIMIWDFGNSDNDYEGDEVPAGYKCKRIVMTFTNEVYLKDGTVYFFDAPWGSYCDFFVEVPQGRYYPNSFGNIPASALGLSGSQMYSYADKDIKFACFVNKHHMYKDCPMGDELNAEGCQLEPVPVGWLLVAYIYTPESDFSLKGYGSFEMYRTRTTILPGDMT